MYDSYLKVGDIHTLNEVLKPHLGPPHFFHFWEATFLAFVTQSLQHRIEENITR